MKKVKVGINETCPYSYLFQDSQAVDSIENNFGIVSSDIITENLSESTLTLAAEIFLYLQSCSATLEPWYTFYKDLFETKSTDLIILTLNRNIKITKKTKNNDLEKINKSLLNKITSMLSLQYMDIQNYLQGFISNNASNTNLHIMKGLKYVVKHKSAKLFMTYALGKLKAALNISRLRMVKNINFFETAKNYF